MDVIVFSAPTQHCTVGEEVGGFTSNLTVRAESVPNMAVIY